MLYKTLYLTSVFELIAIKENKTSSIQDKPHKLSKTKVIFVVNTKSVLLLL